MTPILESEENKLDSSLILKERCFKVVPLLNRRFNTGSNNNFISGIEGIKG